MHIELKNTAGSMIGCAKNEKIERMSVRDNEERLKLRYTSITCLVLCFCCSVFLHVNILVYV